ncbi:helix-hairpin-helix domain-containing protein [Actinoplanes sp. NPDC051513]|uniref:helix-hairpin-helix domain-containing protein n=1 Tax=Actinoplanes sp. NPDC051513 TaxID=3363908 RepID=UPI0037BBCA3C
MASFLFLVLGVVVGLVGGWFLRGLRAGSQPAPTESAPIAPATAPATKAEPAAEAETEASAAVVVAAEVADPKPEADEKSAPASEKEAEEPAAVAETAEPVAEATPAAEPEPVAATEPAAEPEPVAPAAEPELVTAAATSEPVVAAPVVTEPVITEPIAVAEPAGTAQVDNLTKIAGIGPKAAAALTTAGITTYRQLADSDETAIRAALAAGGVRATAAISTWPERAKQLVDPAS